MINKRVEPLHPIAWLCWLVAAALPALLTRNPLYLALALLATATTYLALQPRSGTSAAWGAFLRFGALLWLLTIPFTMLTAHYGRIVLFRLPAGWPVIGGAITGEAFLYGLGSGLALLTLLATFAAFNMAVDQARLLRLTPGFLYQAGVIAAIAVAFVPQMIVAWETVREAQAVRGHKVRGLRDLLPLIMPLLITALERAMRLAESMEARGFGRELAPASSRRLALQQLALIVGLALIGGGLAAAGFWPAQRLAIAGLLALGAGLLALSFWDQGRRVRRTRYHRWLWSGSDRLICATAALVGLAWLAITLWHGEWLLYYPYPPYSPWPTFRPLLGVLAALPAFAGLLLPGGEPSPRPSPCSGEPQPAAGRAAGLARLKQIIAAALVAVLWRR